MTSAAKAKGSSFEREVAAVFNEGGFEGIERSYGAGRQDDRGDLRGFRRPLVIEAKNHRALDLAGWAAEAERERVNAGADLAVVVAKRRGHHARRAYAIVGLEEMVALLKRAGY